MKKIGNLRLLKRDVGLIYRKLLAKCGLKVTRIYLAYKLLRWRVVSVKTLGRKIDFFEET